MTLEEARKVADAVEAALEDTREVHKRMEEALDEMHSAQDGVTVVAALGIAIPRVAGLTEKAAGGLEMAFPDFSWRSGGPTGMNVYPKPVRLYGKVVDD